MRRFMLVAMLLLLPIASGCQAALGVTDEGTPSPSTNEPVVANEEKVIGTMRFWLEDFRSKQRELHDQTGHYAENVTVEGRIRPLGSPYKTNYWVSESLKGYEIIVSHGPTRRACNLAKGRHAHPDDDGKILCND